MDNDDSKQVHTFEISASDSTLFHSKRKTLISGLVAALALMTTFVAWTLSSPLGSSPDETFHIGSIWCADGLNTEFCEVIEYSPDAQSNRVLVPHVMDICFIFYSEQSANCSNDARSKQPELVANNFLYPPLFYTTHSFLVIEQSQVSGLSMRLLNSAIATFVFFMAVILSPNKARGYGLIPFLVTLVPLAIFLIPSLNPSSWAYIGIAFGWLFQLNATRAVDNNSKAANWIMFFICAALAMGSRWDSMIYACVSIIFVYALNMFERVKFDWVSMVLPLIVLMLGIGLLVNHFLLSASSSESVFGNPGSISTEWTDLNRNIHNLINLIGIPAGTFGLSWGIGWLDTPLPAIVGIVGVSCYAYFFIGSMPYRRKRNYLLILLLWFFPAALLMYYYSTSKIIVGEQVQPRYVLPLIPLLLGIALASSKLNTLNDVSRNQQLVFISGLIALSHSISLWTNIRRYTLGLEANQGYNLSNPENPIEWWWRWAPSPNFVFVVGSLAFTLFVFSSMNIIKGKSTPKKSIV
jgi:hypothetical protein